MRFIIRAYSVFNYLIKNYYEFKGTGLLHNSKLADEGAKKKTGVPQP